jgi:hypothetical protein
MIKVRTEGRTERNMGIWKNMGFWTNEKKLRTKKDTSLTRFWEPKEKRRKNLGKR